MKISIYLKIEGKKKLHLFHELEIKDEDLAVMLKNGLKGFHIVNPMYPTLLTIPSSVVGGFDNYQVDILQYIKLPYEGEVMTICSLC